MEISHLESQANAGHDIGLCNYDLRALVGYVRNLESDVDTLANNKLNLLSEVCEYLIAAEAGSMSRNNSEALAGELLEKLTKPVKLKG